jgi:hypothetical protein
MQVPDDAAATPEQRPAGDQRLPLVHRLAAAIGGPVPTAASDTAELPALIEAVKLDAQRTVQRPRRKPRQLHGEVTIIRPMLDAAAETPFARSAEPATLSAPSDALDVSVNPFLLRESADPVEDQWRYAGLLARIQSLEVAAQEIKQSEAAEAVEWIKETVRAYRLTKQDLGLR